MRNRGSWWGELLILVWLFGVLGVLQAQVDRTLDPGKLPPVPPSVTLPIPPVPAVPAVPAAPVEPITTLKTIRTLLPYEDFSKALQQSVGKYVLLTFSEYEALKRAKEAYLASAAAPLADQSPMVYRFLSARLEGALEGDFARFTGEFTLECLRDGWQEIELLQGMMAIASASLDGQPVTLAPRLTGPASGRVLFERDRRAGISGGALTKNTFVSTRQENWLNLSYTIFVKGRGRHQCRVEFLLPIDRTDQRYHLQMGLAPVPLTFFRLENPLHQMAVETTSLRDYSVDALDGDEGSAIAGWLGARGQVQITWRHRMTTKLADPVPPPAPTPVPTPVAVSPASASQKVAKATDTVVVAKATETTPLPVAKPVKPPVRPLIYSRSETLITLGEGAMQGRTDFDFSISRAPVSRLEIAVPDGLKILTVQADRPETHQIQKTVAGTRLLVDFSTAREDRCSITLTYEVKVDEKQELLAIPEVYPLGVVREPGAIAVQALTSVEVRPGEDKPASEGRRAFRVDPAELPEALRHRVSRPILLAYRFASRPAGAEIVMKRYEDIAQKTIVADVLDAKTAFTTNRSSSTQINLRIRNNNRQFVSFQLASSAEILSAFLDGKPVKPVADKTEGKILIPLRMSRALGRPEEMELRMLLKQPIATMSWSGQLAFAPPLVDIPVSRFTWTLFAPVHFHLYGFSGTVQSTVPPRDPFFFRGFLQIGELAWDLIREPALLFFLGFILLGILAVVSREILFQLLTGIWDLCTGLFRFLFSGAAFRLVEVLIVLGVIGILAAIATPNFKKAREQSRDKSCYANIRVIQGAVEMHNMDNSDMIRSVSSPVLGSLVDKGYLKSAPRCPSLNGSYQSVGDLSEGGLILCSIHGAVDADDQKIKELQSAPTFAGARAGSEDVRQKPATGIGASSGVSGKTGAGATFRGGKAKGVQPIEGKLIITANFSQFERDLVIADVDPKGGISENRTSPTLKVTYMRREVILALRIIAFLLGMLMGVYFILGCRAGEGLKAILSLILAGVLSYADLNLPLLGDMANNGFWVALSLGVLWKFVTIIMALSANSGSDENPPSASGPAGGSGGAGKVADAKVANATVSGLTVVLLGLVLNGMSAAPAQAQAPAAQEKEIRVLVPFHDLHKVLETQDKSIILPEEDYRYLTDLGTRLQKPVEDPAPRDFVIRSAHYQGTAELRGIRFTGRFEFEVLNPGWKALAFLADAVVPSNAMLDGKPAALQLLPTSRTNRSAYGIYTDLLGRHVLETEFFLPGPQNDIMSRKFEMDMVHMCVARLHLTVPDPDCEAAVDPGAVTSIATTSSATVFQALVPPSQKIRFEWFRRFPEPIEEPKPVEDPNPVLPATPSVTVTASPTPVLPPTPPPTPEVVKEETRVSLRETILLSFDEGFVRGRHVYLFDVTGTDGIATFGFRVPVGQSIQKVEGGSLDTWKVEEAGEKTEQKGMNNLVLFFPSRLKGKFAVTVEYEEDTQNLTNDVYSVREFLPDPVDRLVGVLGIAAPPILNISLQGSPEGYSPIDTSEFVREIGDAGSANIPYAFKYLRHGNELNLSVVRNQDKEVQTAIVDKVEALSLINEDGYLITRVVYQVRNSSEQFLKVRLPVIASITAELWSSEVAFQPVKAGFDRENGIYNIPIIRSPNVQDQPQAFLTEIVYATKLPLALESFLPIRTELPGIHLDISEMSWTVFLPEGYELMKGQANVDLSMTPIQQPLLQGQYAGTGLNTEALAGLKTQVSIAGPGGNSESLFGFLGLLPVKFTIPVTNWGTSYTMQQIDPRGTAPFVEGILVTPRQGVGRLFSLLMILCGALGGFALVQLCRGRQPGTHFLILAVLGALLGVSVWLKLYQADHSFKMGFMMTAVLGILYLLFRYQPPEKR